MKNRWWRRRRRRGGRKLCASLMQWEGLGVCFSPGLAEPTNPTRRKGSRMEASDNNLFLFFLVWVFQGSACEITKSYCMFLFLFSHLHNLCEQTEYKRAGSCSVIYN